MWKRKGSRKYGNRKVSLDGHTFDSKAESEMYAQLRLLERAGKIKQLKLQPRYTLLPTMKIAGKSQNSLVYVADFEYFDVDQQRIRVVDCKGFKTREYIIKKKLFNYIHHNAGLYIEENI